MGWYVFLNIHHSNMGLQPHIAVQHASSCPGPCAFTMAGLIVRTLLRNRHRLTEEPGPGPGPGRDELGCTLWL